MDHEQRPPGRFPEDLEANLRLAEALAPTHCVGCNGYHLARVRRRLKSPAPDALDRTEMVQLLRGRLAGHRAAPPKRAEILIAGSADTNLLATCAEAAAEMEIVRYTVLDRCRTPLALCEAFARRHRLDVQTNQFDMGASDGAFAADVIVVHSLLRFLPNAAHLSTMAALQRWLKPGGAIVFSHRLMPEAREGEPYYQAEYQSVEQIEALFAQAGLRIVSLEEAVEQGGPRHRILALLEAR